MGPPSAFVGEIILLPFDLTPRNCRPCKGELLPIADNTALFSLIGTNFGGDGKNNFALPNLIQQAPAKFNYYISMGGVLAPRA
ncbi:MAG: tail fiber protein [Pyrinomonadaceae bacterium]|nr:tail fiber protein [Pyrinomonadaceae bacterium]